MPALAGGHVALAGEQATYHNRPGPLYKAWAGIDYPGAQVSYMGATFKREAQRAHGPPDTCHLYPAPAGRRLDCRGRIAYTVEPMCPIDMHTHAFPDDLAERAIRQLEANAEWEAVGDGRVSGLVESMDSADIDISVVCAIATRPDQVKGIFKWCKKIRSDRIEPLPSVHPRTPKAGKWVRRFAKAGFAGIKLHPMFQDFAADDSQADEILAAAAECGLLVTMHCGRDVTFPQDDRASPLRMRRLIDRHPDLKLLCTHMGGWLMWDEVERHLLGAGVYMETSFWMKFMPLERCADMIRRHGAGRVMFGTDWPWSSQGEELALLDKLQLTKGEKKAVLWSNAAKLLGY